MPSITNFALQGRYELLVQFGKNSKHFGQSALSSSSVHVIISYDFTELHHYRVNDVFRENQVICSVLITSLITVTSTKLITG